MKCAAAAKIDSGLGTLITATPLREAEATPMPYICSGNQSAPMPENPYSPPGTEVKDQAQKPGSPLKAFVVGLVIDIGGTLVAGILLGIAYSVLLASAGRSPEQIAAALQDLSPTSTLGILSAALGCALSVLGGFACARIARSTDYKLGSMLAATSTCIGLLLTGDDGSMALNLTMAAVTAVCVLLGTRLGMSRPGA